MFRCDYDYASANADCKAKAVVRLFEAFEASNRQQLNVVLDALQIRGQWEDGATLLYTGYDYDVQSWLAVRIGV